MVKKMETENTESASTLELKSQGNIQPVFYSIWGDKYSENTLITSSQVFSDNIDSSQSTTSKFAQESTLATATD